MGSPTKPTLWARAMVWVGLLAALGLAASSVPSYLELELTVHLTIAVLSSLVAIFAHSWIVIYLWQTGRAVRQLSTEAGLAEELGAPALRLTRWAWPWALLLLAAVVVTALFGEYSFDHSMPAGVHHGAGWALVLLQWVAVLAEQRLLAKNHRLVTQLAQLLPG